MTKKEGSMFTFAKSDLLAAVAKVSRVAPMRGASPALECVRITSEKTGIARIASTNLYEAATVDVSAEHTDQPLACNAKALLDRVKAMPDGPVTLSLDGARVLLKSSGAKRSYAMPSFPADDMPTIHAASGHASSLPADVLAKVLATVKHAISTDETRAHLNSVLLEWEGKTLRAVATDGHRLALCEESTGDAVGSFRGLIPLRAIAELGDLDAKDALTIAFDQSSVTLSQGTSTFTSRLVDATFPPYGQVIPKTTALHVTCDRARLLDAVRAVALSAAEKTGGVVLSLSKKEIHITASDAGKGDADDAVECTKYEAKGEGGAKKIGLAAKYITDALSVIASDEVTLGVSGDLDPVKIVDGGVTLVVMPMRV